MDQGELIDSKVSLQQCKLAVEALHSHQSKLQEKRAENELLPGKEQHIWLVLAVKKIHPVNKIKPLKIPIVHPLVDPRTTPICLITKDPQREYKDLLEANGVKFISRVVGVAKLKGKFKPFEARRMLLKENGMFLADERVIPLLPGLLGKKWFAAKKQPIPVCLTRKNLKSELERAVSSTYMHQNQGTCVSIKIGCLSQTPAQILSNLKKALPAIVKNVRDEWSNVQSFHIKTNSSASLPIWTCTLDDSEGGRWGGLSLGKGEEETTDDEEENKVQKEVDTVGPSSPATTSKAADRAYSPSVSAIPTHLPSKPDKTQKKTDLPKEWISESLNKEGLKRKRSSEAGERKKVKVVKETTQKTADQPNERTSESPGKDEMKRKRSSAAGEKKKVKVVKETTQKTADQPNERTSESLGKDEMKRKRSIAAGEKKKVKVIKGTAGRSVKDEIVRRKAA